VVRDDDHGNQFLFFVLDRGKTAGIARYGWESVTVEGAQRTSYCLQRKGYVRLQLDEEAVELTGRGWVGPLSRFSSESFRWGLDGWRFES